MEVLSYKTFRELEKNLETAEVVKGVVHKSAADIAELELLFFFKSLCKRWNSRVLHSINFQYWVFVKPDYQLVLSNREETLQLLRLIVQNSNDRNLLIYPNYMASEVANRRRDSHNKVQ